MDVFLRNTNLIIKLKKRKKQNEEDVDEENKYIIFMNIFIYVEGRGAKHNLISPRDATKYLTTNGRSFSRYISI